MENFNLRLIKNPILNETKKAYLIGFDLGSGSFCGNTNTTMYKRWVPKSVIEINGNIGTFPSWYAIKNLNGTLKMNGTLFTAFRDTGEHNYNGPAWTK